MYWSYIEKIESCLMTVRIGIRSRTAVSQSIAVMPTAASPITFTTSLSGWASFVPIASPSENPSWVEWPQARYERRPGRPEHRLDVAAVARLVGQDGPRRIQRRPELAEHPIAGDGRALGREQRFVVGQ